LTFAYVLFDGKINKDILDRLALDTWHSEPAEVNISGLLRKPSFIARDCTADQQRLRANTESPRELRKGALTDTRLIACHEPAKLSSRNTGLSRNRGLVAPNCHNRLAKAMRIKSDDHSPSN
jgi:hypothetical protein